MRIQLIFLALFCFSIGTPSSEARSRHKNLQDMDDDTVTECRILEKRKRGKREPSGYVIKSYNPKGKKLDEYRAPDGGFFTRYDEADLTLLTLVDNGDCPRKK